MAALPKIPEHVFKYEPGKAAPKILVPANDNRKAAVKSLSRATPWTFVDPSTIPPRAWLYGRHYIRKYVSVTVSPGGVGKTSKSIAEALAMATGRDLLGVKPAERARVWMWNGEDPKEELDRRISAACVYYGIRPEEIAGWLFVDSGREHSIIAAEQTKDGTRIAVPLRDALIDEIQARKIDVMIVDPFVSSHAVSENDNMAMDAVIKQFWAPIIEATNCACELIHHAKKMGGFEVTAESARGAVSLIGAARSAVALNGMTQDQANKANVENRHLYFWATDAKANMAPREESLRWFRLESVDLGNATSDRPSDHVGVVTRWEWPNTMSGVTVADLRAVQKEIEAGEWLDNIRAQDGWAGHAVAKVMGLNLDDPKDKERVKTYLKTWKASGMLKVERRKNDKREERSFLIVGEWADDLGTEE